MTRSQREWDRAAYSPAEVGRLVDLTPNRVRRWLKGYAYRYDTTTHFQRPVIHRTTDAEVGYASFLELVDLLFVKRFLAHGLSLQKVRKALDEASRILDTDHFARRSFFTDGSNIYLQVKEVADSLLELLSGGQWVIAPIIQELAAQIDFDSPTGLARRWYPMGQAGLVVLDPLISFGRPTVVGRGIATANVYDFFLAENRRMERACSWFSLELQEVRAAVQFEERLAA